MRGTVIGKRRSILSATLITKSGTVPRLAHNNFVMWSNFIQYMAERRKSLKVLLLVLTPELEFKDYNKGNKAMFFI